MRAQEKKIKEFIGGLDKVFIIPPFQRHYVWDEKNCLELWDDLINSMNTSVAHYLGNIIYYPSKESGAAYTELILVDGQQRLTTILLILAAIRDTTTDENLKNDINNKYLKNDVRNEKYRIRLKAGLEDNESFENIIDGNLDSLNDSNLFTNYNLFLAKLTTSNINHQKLFDAIANCDIVDINLQPDDNLLLVQTVFEKINSTGKELTAGDLIRNLLLTSNSVEIQNIFYSEYWVKIEDNIGVDKIPEFIYDYLLIKLSPHRFKKTDVYDRFKECLKNKDLSKKEVLAELLMYSKHYKYLVEKEICPNEKIAKNIREIIMLKATDLNALLLLLFNEMYQRQETELEKIVSLLADFILRYRFVKDYSGGGALQSVVGQIINKLIKEEITYNYNDILFELSNSGTKDGEFPSNERFKERLATKVFTNDEAKVLLNRIEYYNNRDVRIDYGNLTLEHIMPKTLSEEWKEYLGMNDEEAMEFHSNYVYNIGNMTLLSGSWNSSFSNSLYDNKRIHYVQNQFKVTREVGFEYSIWNKESIEKRNSYLAEKSILSTIGPLARTRPYTKDNRKTSPSGQYFLTEDIKTEKTKITKLFYGEKEIECTTWYNLLPTVAKIALSVDADKFNEIIEKNLICKATGVKVSAANNCTLTSDPLISKRPDLLQDARLIENTDYYFERVISSAMARKHTLKLINEMGFSEDDFIIEIE